MNDVETHVEPPACDHDHEHGGGGVSSRLTVGLIAADDVSYDASVQLFDDAAADPEAFADALLRAALAVAQLAGTDYAWAVVQRFAGYDGSGR